MKFIKRAAAGILALVVSTGFIAGCREEESGNE